MLTTGERYFSHGKNPGCTIICINFIEYPLLFLCVLVASNAQKPALPDQLPVCMRRMVPGRIPTRVLVGGRLPGDHHHPWGIRIPLITADKDSRNVILPDPSSPPARSAARGTPQGQWQRPSSGVAVRVAVGAPTGSIGQLQIRAGGVSRGRVLVFPVSGVTLDVKGGETGCGTAVGAGALTQAQANKANMTNAATSRGTVSVFLSTGICRSSARNRQ